MWWDVFAQYRIISALTPKTVSPWAKVAASSTLVGHELASFSYS